MTDAMLSDSIITTVFMNILLRRSTENAGVNTKSSRHIHVLNFTPCLNTVLSKKHDTVHNFGDIMGTTWVIKQLIMNKLQ